MHIDHLIQNNLTSMHANYGCAVAEHPVYLNKIEKTLNSAFDGKI